MACGERADGDDRVLLVGVFGDRVDRDEDEVDDGVARRVSGDFILGDCCFDGGDVQALLVDLVDINLWPKLVAEPDTKALPVCSGMSWLESAPIWLHVLASMANGLHLASTCMSKSRQWPSPPFP